MLHWFSCPDCLSVVSAGADADAHVRAKPRCGACGAGMEYDGRTQDDGAAYRYAAERCACDNRCTGARGPNCSCQCGGVNHGTGRTVTVTIVEGVPHMSAPRDAAKLVAKVVEFRAARDAVRASIEARFGDLFRRKAAGEWVSDFGAYLDGRGYLTDLRAACGKRTHAARMSGIALVARQLAGVAT